MKLSLNWLKQFIDLKNVTPEKLAEKLTMAGHEVEKIEYLGRGLENIIVGEILEIKKHPNADKLELALVKVSSQKKLKIVCGAPNIKIGQKVPVALAGIILPNGMKIEKVEIRGVISNGMLCAEDELDIGDDHDGILILPNSAKIGQSIAKILKLDDVVLDIDVTPNRGDCMSVFGLAREIEAILAKSQKSRLRQGYSGQAKVKSQIYKLKVKSKDRRFYSSMSISSLLSITVKDKKLCPKYCARIVEGVKVSESPQWLKSRLIAAGQRPVNNIVDATNYVMLELGQPLHAFDYLSLRGARLRHAKPRDEAILSLLQHPSDFAKQDGIASSASPASLPARALRSCRAWQGWSPRNDKPGIIVRRAKNNEALICLDGKKRKLNESMLIIADSACPIALAGVIGGRDTEVSNSTQDIILESAIFDSVSIRKTSRKLGLISEASKRFERKIDSEITETALDLAAQMIAEIAGGKIVKDALIIKADERSVALRRHSYGASATEAMERKRPKVIGFNLELNYLEKLLGIQLDIAQVKIILENLGFKIIHTKAKLSSGHIASPALALQACSCAKASDDKSAGRQERNKGKRFLGVLVPSWRHDVSLPADIAEEIGRILDYNSFKLTNLQAEIKPAQQNQEFVLENKIKNILASLGFDEVMNYSHTAIQPYSHTAIQPLEVLNPINPDQQYLRTSLLPYLQQNTGRNLKNFDEVKIFESGRVYSKMSRANTANSLVSGVKEEKQVAGIISVKKKSEYELHREIKGVIEQLLNQLNINQTGLNFVKKESQINFKVKNDIIGFIDLLPNKMKFKIKQAAAAFVLDFKNLVKLSQKVQLKYQPVSKFPSIQRDLSFVFAAGKKYAILKQVLEDIFALKNDIIVDFQLLDEYQISNTERSLTWRFIYQSQSRTLESQEIEEIEQKIIKIFKQKFKAKLRS